MKEDRRTEFKSKVTVSFLKTVSAFANYGGGIILFGVSDYGIEVGLENPEESYLTIEKMINDSIDPRPEFSIRTNESTGVITLAVSDSPDKPYFYKGKAYKRSDISTAPVGHTELRRLSLAGLNMNYEDLEYQDQNLSFKALTKQFSDILGIKKLDESVLRSLGLKSKDGKFNNAAAILSDRNDFGGIDIVRFGKSIDEMLDRKRLSGESIFRCYDAALQAYRTYYQYELIEGMKRESISRIPEEAFREAIANALVHREWDERTPISVSMMDDRIEIVSPGGLPDTIIEDDFMKNGVFSLRNPVLANVMYRLEYIEMFGTGTARILSAYSGLDVKPVFEVSDNRLIITLPVTDGKLKMTTNEKAVRDVLASGMELSSSEVRDMVGFSRDKTIRMLNSLVRKNYIKVIGNGRGTKYTI